MYVDRERCSKAIRLRQIAISRYALNLSANNAATEGHGTEQLASAASSHTMLYNDQTKERTYLIAKLHGAGQLDGILFVNNGGYGTAISDLGRWTTLSRAERRSGACSSSSPSVLS